LHHAPDAEKGDQDQNGGKRGDPAQHVMRAAPDMAHRAAVQFPAAVRRGLRVRDEVRLPLGLTGIGGRASVAALPGIMR
jgi:hypothetical protein